MTADLDYQADRLGRAAAFLLYLGHDFNRLATEKGWRCGEVDDAITSDPRELRFRVRSPADDRWWDQYVGESAILRVMEEHEVGTDAVIFASIARPGEYFPRWIGEKRAAAVLAAIVARELPAIEQPQEPPRHPIGLEEFRKRGTNATVKTIDYVGQDGRIMKRIDWP